MGNPIPNIVLHPQFVGTTDSADFQGPIARSFSDDFRHFFTQIATEYDGDPIPTVADSSRLGGDLSIRPIFRVWSPHPFLTTFAIFHSNRHRIFTQGRGFTLCAFNALLSLVLLWFSLLVILPVILAVVRD